MLDIVEPRENLRQTLRKLLALHELASSGDSDADALRERLPDGDGAEPVTDPETFAGRAPWDVVQLARHTDRPNTLEYVGFVFDDFQELNGDRLFDQDAAIVCGVARLGDLAVVVVGHQKGHSTSEMMERNFGMPQPDGYRKALRLMRYAARFGMPIVTFVDTPGAYPGIGAEERGQSIAIAESIMEMSRLPVPIVTIVTGEGGSGGALALAVGDRVLMMENAYYSVISPEGLLDDSLQGRCPGIPGRRGAAVDSPRPRPPRDHGRDRSRAGRRSPYRSGRRRRERQDRHHEHAPRAAGRARRGVARPTLRPLPGIRCPGAPTRPARDRREPMTDPDKGASAPDRELIESVWQEARDLIKKLEGSTVQRLRVEAGEYRIEIERGMPAGAVVQPAAAGPAAPAASAAGSAADGAPPAEADGRHAILAPLVGTFYRAPQPGAKPFVEEGDVVDVGQTVAVVEAMKLMNHVQADEAGRVAEILVEDGAWVEFEQALIIFEPVGRVTRRVRQGPDRESR